MYLIKATENHVQSYPQCSGKQMWVESGEIQRGSSWREQLKCDTISFMSKYHNLCAEVKSNKRGPKTAVVNNNNNWVTSRHEIHFNVEHGFA